MRWSWGNTRNPRAGVKTGLANLKAGGLEGSGGESVTSCCWKDVDYNVGVRGVCSTLRKRPFPSVIIAKYIAEQLSRLLTLLLRPRGFSCRSHMVLGSVV